MKTRLIVVSIICFGFALACGSNKKSGSQQLSDVWEIGVDRFGNDYKDFDVPGSDPAPCQNACQADSKCKAWTWQQPDEGVPAHCFLKEAVSDKSELPGYISGIKK